MIPIGKKELEDAVEAISEEISELREQIRSLCLAIEAMDKRVDELIKSPPREIRTRVYGHGTKTKYEKKKKADDAG